MVFEEEIKHYPTLLYALKQKTNKKKNPKHPKPNNKKKTPKHKQYRNTVTAIINSEVKLQLYTSLKTLSLWYLLYSTLN